MTMRWGRGCGQDEAVRKALRSGEWSADLRAHAARCRTCQEVVLVTMSLRPLAAQGDHDPLPDPSLLLRKAHLLARLQARQADLDRAARPLDVAAGACLAAAGALLAWTTWSAVPLLAALAFLGGLRAVWERG